MVGLPALWLVPEEAVEKGVAGGTGWSARGLGWTSGVDEAGEEVIGTWGEAREAFCAALWEAEWWERLGRVGRLLPVSEEAVLAGAVVLLFASLAGQFARGRGGPAGPEAVLVEWAVHLAMVAALGAVYLAVCGVFLALRRAEGRRATVLALAVVSRVAFPVLAPLLCLEGGLDWAKAAWGAARRLFL